MRFGLAVLRYKEQTPKLKEKKHRWLKALKELEPLIPKAEAAAVDHIKGFISNGRQMSAILDDDTESLIGVLNWAATLLWPAVAFLRRLRFFATELIQRHGRCHRSFNL